MEKNYHSSSTICKKSHVDIFKITPTGRSQKRIIKKKHPVYDDLDLNDAMGSIETQTKAYIYGQTTTNAFFQIIYLKYGFQ